MFHFLITPEEGRHTKEYDEHYVILPEYHWWSGHENYSDGRVLDDGFYYSSLNNTEWFSVEDINKLLASL